MATIVFNRKIRKALKRAKEKAHSRAYDEAEKDYKNELMKLKIKNIKREKEFVNETQELENKIKKIEADYRKKEKELAQKENRLNVDHKKRMISIEEKDREASEKLTETRTLLQEVKVTKDTLDKKVETLRHLQLDLGVVSGDIRHYDDRLKDALKNTSSTAILLPNVIKRNK